ETVMGGQIGAEDFPEAQETGAQRLGVAAGSGRNRTKLLGHRILDLERTTGLVHTSDIAHPARYPQGQALDPPSSGKPLTNGAEQTLRQLLRAVHGDLRRAMLQRRVGKPCQQTVAI